MQTMVESVRKGGVLTPAVVRPKDDGRYELVSGHRRKFAAALAGLAVLPVIVREMTRDEAVIAMIDANLQREVILPSEKAFSYKMKLEALKRQGQRTDLTSTQVAGKLRGKESAEIVGEATGESKDTVRRYIRLTELVPALLQLVDEGKIAFNPAINLSYLQKKEQDTLLEAVQAQDATPSLAQAMKLKLLSQEGKLTPEGIHAVMREEKPNQVEQFRISKAKLSKYFPAETPAKQMEDTFIKALEQYRQREKRREGR